MKRYNVFVLIENYSKQVEDIVADGLRKHLNLSEKWVMTLPIIN